jgi:hypothetical protein
MRASRRWREATLPSDKLNAARTERRFLFWRCAGIFFEDFFGGSMRSALGAHIGKFDAIRFYRMREWRGR